MLNATFIIEQHVGHRTVYQNLRRFVDPMPQIQANWVKVTYESSTSPWRQIPFLSRHWRGSLIGRDQVRRGLNDHAGDVVIFFTQVPAALGGKLTMARPYVLYMDITPLQYDEMAEHYGHRPDTNGIIKWYKHRVNTRMMRGAAKIFPFSHWAAQSLIHDYGVDPARVEVIPPVVDLELWHPVERDMQGPMRILFVGGELARKGGDDLLEAFRSLPPDSAELVLVTRDKLPQEPGVFVYNDLRPNTPELIALCQSCDVFALPTKGEAFGIAAVEASAMGLPVITTRVGGLTDIVVEGETGLFVPAGDVTALAQHLHRLAQDHELRRRLGRGARARAETHFDARANVARMAALLQEVVHCN